MTQEVDGTFSRSAPAGGSRDAGDYTPRSMALFRKGIQVLQEVLEELRQAWNHLLQQVNDFINRAREEVENSLWARVAEWWTDEIADGIEQIRQVVEQVRQKVDQLVKTLEESIQGAIPVGSLFERATTYVTTLNRELSGIGEDMSGSINLVYWRGLAKDAYVIKAQEQKDAVQSTHRQVKETGKWLAAVGKENMTYMAELGDRVAEVLGPFAAAAADAVAAGAGAYTQALFSLHSLSEVIGEAVNQALQYAINLARRLSDVSQQVIDLASESEDRSGLGADGNARWPQVAAV